MLVSITLSHGACTLRKLNPSATWCCYYKALSSNFTLNGALTNNKSARSLPISRTSTLPLPSTNHPRHCPPFRMIIMLFHCRNTNENKLTQINYLLFAPHHHRIINWKRNTHANNYIRHHWTAEPNPIRRNLIAFNRFKILMDSSKLTFDASIGS